MTDMKAPPETSAVVLPVDPTRRTEIDKQRVPMSARPYRLLALVKQDAVVRVQKEPDDTVMTWPHLLTIEFLAAGVMSIFLLLMGLFINAPLEELANGNVTPAVAKAPWYFLGLQELLAYFHPTVAGVLVPTFVLVGAALIPYVDRGEHPRRPPVASARRRSMLFTMFCILGPDRDLRRHLLPRPGLHVRHPVRDEPRPPFRSLMTLRRTPARMSNYHVEPIDKPAALTKEAIKSLRKQQVQGLSRRQLMRAAIGAGVGLWLLEVTAGHARLHLAEPGGRLRRRRSRSATSTTIKLQNSHPADRGGLPGLLSPRRAPSSSCSTPASSGSSPGEDTTGDGDGAQRPGALPALPAPRLQAEPVPQELLVRVPVPRLALRPARDQGRRRRSSARRRASMDRFSITVDGVRRADRQHRQDHARAAAGRARPARAHPAAHADRAASDAAAAWPEETDDRHAPTTAPSWSPSSACPVPRPPVEPAPVERFTSPPSTRTVELTPERAAQVVRQSSNARWVGFLAVVVVILFVAIYWFYELAPLGLRPSRGSKPRPTPSRSPRSSAATTSTRRTARAATAPTGEGGIGPALNRQDKLFAHLNDELHPTTCSPSAAATSAATRTR